MKKIYKNRPNFLGSEVGLVRKTITVSANNENAIEENGRKIVVAGTIFTTPYYGLLFEDVDVTDGDKLGSLMIRGSYINANLPKTAASVSTNFANQGLYAIEEGTLTRPDFGTAGLAELSAPTTSVSTATISWAAVTGAISYTIFDANMKELATQTTTSYTATKTGKYYVQANGDNINKVASPLATANVTSLA